MHARRANPPERSSSVYRSMSAERCATQKKSRRALDDARLNSMNARRALNGCDHLLVGLSGVLLFVLTRLPASYPYDNILSYRLSRPTVSLWISKVYVLGIIVYGLVHPPPMSSRHRILEPYGGKRQYIHIIQSVGQPSKRGLLRKFNTTSNITDFQCRI